MGRRDPSHAARIRTMLALLSLGLGAIAVLHAAGPTSYAGRQSGAALTLLAGACLAGAAGALSLGHRPARAANLALAASFTWFAPVWVAWPNGPSAARSLAAVLSAFTFPLLLHLVLAHPSARVRSPIGRGLVFLVYVEAAVSALILALFRDPYFDPGCWANCTVNDFLVSSQPSLAHAVEDVDRWFTAVAAIALVAVCAARLARASQPARRRLIPVLFPAVVAAAAVTARAIALQALTVEKPFESALFAIFVVGSAAVALLGAGLAGDVLRGELERRAVGRIAARLDEAPAPGSVQAALAEALGDPDLRVTYRLGTGDRWADASGRIAEAPRSAAGRTLTPLTRNGTTIAIIAHAGTAPDLEEQIGPAARLGLENERLQAEALARLAELRESQARIVATADGERQRLERDLHDGAQQRMLSLSYRIRLAHAAARARGENDSVVALERATEEADAALDELRELAHGLFPAVLAEAGLGAALATLADVAVLPVAVHGAGDARYPAAIETAAYFAVVEAVSDAAARNADQADVTLVQDDGRLVVTVADNGSERSAPLIALNDRVGALGGSLSFGENACRVELPCV